MASDQPTLKISGTPAAPRARRAYIIGPMRGGYPLLNFPAFDDAAFRGRQKGFHVISPAEIDRALGLDPATFNGFTLPEVRACAERDLTQVIKTLEAEHGDVVALLPGWERSSGGLMELSAAMFVGLGLYDARTWEPMDAAALAGIDWQGLCNKFLDRFRMYKAAADEQSAQRQQGEQA